MSCCGGARQQLGGIGRPAALPPTAAAPARRFTIAFEYTGATALTVVGPASGRRYRFEGPGARQVVDPRDRPSLARVPRLREIG
jgi:hypothetical protein